MDRDGSSSPRRRNASGRPGIRRGRPAPVLAVAALAAAAFASRVLSRPAGPEPETTPQAPGQVRASVTLVQADGAKHPAVDAVVWLPDAAAAAGAGAAGTAKITQREKAFEPHVEVVPVGSTVAFPNLDRIYHNVFSLSEIARFDLGLYRNGASRSVTFAKPGVIRIYCNIHPAMSAVLVVVEGQAYAKTGADGRALLPPVRPGRYRLSVWHERGGEKTLEVVVRAGGVTPVELSLDASQWRPEKHKNKYGKDYPPPDDDETRY